MPPRPTTGLPALRLPGLFGPACALLGFSLAMPLAWGSLAIALLLLAWLLRGDWRLQFKRLRASTPALWALALLLLLLLGSLYSQGSPQQVHYALNKNAKLLLLPILVMAATDARWRQRALDGFLLGLGIEVAVSYGRWLGLLPRFADPGQPYTGLINHIAFGLMLGVGCFAFGWRALQPGRRRWLWGLLALLTGCDALFISSGRTGYAVLLALLAAACVRRWRWRGLLIGLLAAAALAGAAMTASGTARMRWQQAATDLQSYRHGQDQTSLGLRLLHDRLTLQVIIRHPLLGTGSGGLAGAIASLDPSLPMPVGNPENQYLLLAAELGLPGLLVLGGLIWSLWRCSSRLAPQQRHLLQQLLLALAVASLFNAPLLDAPEGRFAVVLAGLLAAAAIPSPKPDASPEPI